MSFSFPSLNNTERKTGTLFGSTTAPAGGLFGQSQQQQQTSSTTTPSLFGSTSAAPQTSSLFGATSAPATGGLFGTSATTTSAPQTGGLFGAKPAAPSTSLFGASTAAQPAQTSSLFGAPAAPQPSSLFGSATAAPQPSSLFGNTQQQNTGTSLFGQPQQQNAGTSLFGQPQQQQQQQAQPQQPNFSNSLFGASLNPAPILNASQAQSVQQQREGLPKLRQSSNQPFAASTLSGQREKSVAEQIRVLNTKWDPQNPDCIFQFYFYNAVKPEEVPFYGPSPGEDERKWEEALAKKPSPGAIPVLARGFEQVAERISQQNAAVNALRTRLHEINNSLALLKDTHELNVASRITEAKRKHVVFTQRTLALATKVQILRNRGYVMDQQEEDLKKKLLELEKRAFDPVLGGRQEEIWARMSGVRERARILQEETERLGKAIEGQGSGELLSEEDQKALDKLLKDYDRQLEHLKKWIVDTKEEYETWEKERPSRPTRR